MLTWQLVMMFSLLGIAVAAIVIAVVMNRLSARHLVSTEHQLSNRIAVLEDELSAMMDAAFFVASHLKKVEVHLKDTVQRQEQLQQRDMGNFPYNDAIRLASKGASVDALVEHCSLSRPEAELVAMLHKKSVPVVGNEDDILSPQTFAEQAGPPTDEQLNATEKTIEKLMAEQYSQLQSDPVHSVNNPDNEDDCAIQPTETTLDNTGDTFYFDEALACSRDFKLRQNSLNKAAVSEEKKDTFEGPHGFNERD